MIALSWFRTRLIARSTTNSVVTLAKFARTCVSPNRIWSVGVSPRDHVGQHGDVSGLDEVEQVGFEDEADEGDEEEESEDGWHGDRDVEASHSQIEATSVSTTPAENASPTRIRRKMNWYVLPRFAAACPK